MATDSPMARTCIASRSATECTVATAMPRLRQVRAIRQAISPRLAMSSLRNTIRALHPQYAELRRLERTTSGQIEREAHHGSRLDWIDYVVDPKITREVVNAGKRLEL